MLILPDLAKRISARHQSFTYKERTASRLVRRLRPVNG
jgi:hypothetical protein